MKNLTESSTFTANVSVPEDNVDLRTAASVETAFQALADRTKYLREFVDAQTPASRTKYVPLHGAWTSSTFALAAGDMPVATATDTGATALVRVPLGRYLPTGATITLVRCLVNPATSVALLGDRMQINLRRATISGTTISGTTRAVWHDSGTAGMQWASSGTISETVSEGHVWEVWVNANLASVAADTFRLVEITFTDPGARNY